MDTTQTPKTKTTKPPAAPTSAILYGEAQGSETGGSCDRDGGNLARVCVTAATRATTHRQLKAAALRLQAAVEDLSDGEQWVTSARMISDTVAVVELELLTGGARELRAALATLRAAVGLAERIVKA